MGVQLLGIPDETGKPILWINADHLVSVASVVRTAEIGLELMAELKVDGMPLYRVPLGRHDDRAAADAAFAEFLNRLQRS